MSSLSGSWPISTGELRAASGEPQFIAHLEAVVMGAPDAGATMQRRRAALRAAMHARRAAAST